MGPLGPGERASVTVGRADGTGEREHMSFRRAASRIQDGTGGMDNESIAEQAKVVERLRQCLLAVYRVNDLQRRELVAAERGIRRLDRQSMAPAPNEFWESIALPRAQRLIDEARRVIDREILTLGALRDEAGALMVAEGDLLDALPSSTAINDLGNWWQQRLRRAAMTRSLPSILARSPGEAELVVSNQEMLLLDRAPWSHGDRLLSAFELANGEVGRFGRQRVTELIARSQPGAGRVRAAGRPSRRPPREPTTAATEP